MDETIFWQLIDKTREASGGDSQKQLDLLIDELVLLPEEEIISFDLIVDHLMVRAYNTNLWAVGDIINCGCSDDGFSDFRSWVIAQGKLIYENALIDPESLMDHVEPGKEAFLENLGYAGFMAYERKTGQDMPDSRSERHVLTGDNLDEEAAKKRYPRLVEKFKDASERLMGG